MARRSTPVRKAWRSLAWLLVIFLGLGALNAAAILWNDGGFSPRLALDLEGGTQIILEPVLEDGQTVSQEQLAQAVSIMRQRIDASGISEAEITTQGESNIVVAIPGRPDEATMERIQSSAQLEFRPVLLTEAAPASSVGGEEEGSTASPSPSAEPTLNDQPSVSPTDASDLNWVTEALYDEYLNVDCSAIEVTEVNSAPSDEPLVTCDDTNTLKYALGPVEVSGERIADASSGLVLNAQGQSTGAWGVNIEFDGEGTEQFGEVTERLFGLTGAQNQFAIVLDGKVISAPTTNAIITDGRPQISGSFTQETARTLADQLKFGALPIGFSVQSEETISATLGTTQLASGLIAGAIGLALVVVYSLIQYRALASVTIASLIIAAALTYLTINWLSWNYGYRLSLAGVAGLIVAIGITADSFIVYFERVRDELRDGRGLESAIESGWKRAFRTVLASDTVNLLAAIVLFVLAVGNVRGFAFTLGITTLIDVIVVSLFTHPMLQLLGQTNFFAEGHKWSGLDPKALGAVYRGRASFRTPTGLPAAKAAKSSKEAERRQTIAERKAAEAELAQASSSKTQSKGKDS